MAQAANGERDAGAGMAVGRAEVGEPRAWPRAVGTSGGRPTRRGGGQESHDEIHGPRVGLSTLLSWCSLPLRSHRKKAKGMEEEEGEGGRKKKVVEGDMWVRLKAALTVLATTPNPHLYSRNQIKNWNEPNPSTKHQMEPTQPKKN